MPLLNETGLLPDAWRLIADHEAIPAQGDAIIPLARLQEALGAPHRGRLGLELPNTARVEDLASAFGRLDLITIEFPAFNDGRGFSLARRLRALGFKGELRAVGRLIPDQLAYARGCGFDSVQLPDDAFARQPLEQWLTAARSMSLSYQTSEAPPGTQSILMMRRAARA